MCNQHQREVAIFEAALQLPPEQRGAYLQQTCEGDPELLERIRALLKAEESQSDFLAPAASAARSEQTLLLVPTEKPGDSIGPYKLLQQIGEGGCGVVYMAEQAKPFRRRVALKIIKLGMDTKQVVARFEAERQALALMDHPNIAKVHDAGATQTGRPYFVMELVRGVKITDYCDEKKLSTRERLELFIQVCQAVQHAHQKGIIHRDLKPSNILVTVNDGVAVPKVIDFGIAKATNGELLTDKTVFTAFEQFIGTPAYMSPEQAEITSVDIDTRSDIYSLGVLLYELLTGQTPFDAKELLQAGLDEMRRTLREKEPARPSTRLRTLGAEELTTAANRRGLEAPKLVNVVCGDLDWIVMKCLEKDRAQRYETANGLATDIRRHLSNEPVVARPPSRLYEFQKTVRRHKLGFAATGAVMLALLLGLSMSTWSLVGERRARQNAVAAEVKAKTEATKSQEVSRFLEEILKSIDPDVASGKDTALLQVILEATALRVEKELANQPDVQIEILGILGSVYDSLGLWGKMEETANARLKLARMCYDGAVPPSLSQLGEAEWQNGRTEQAVAHFTEALAMYKKLFGDQDRNVAYALRDLGAVLYSEGKLAEAGERLREGIAICDKLAGEQDKPLAGLHGGLLFSLAYVYADEGRLPDAEEALRSALALEKQKNEQGTDMIMCQYRLGDLLRAESKLTDAEDNLAKALALAKRLKSPWLPEVLNSLAVLYQAQGKSVLAEATFREALAVTSTNSNADYGFRADFGQFLMDGGRLTEAEAMLRQAFDRGTEHAAAGDPRVGRVLTRLLAVLRLEKKYGECEKLLDGAIEHAPGNFALRNSRALFYARCCRWREAAADLRQALALRPGDHLVWHSLAAVLVQEHELEDYRSHCRRSLDQFGDTPDARTAHRISKDCLILPGAVTNLGLVARMAEFALKATPMTDMGRYWVVVGHALAQYRLGNFALAADGAGQGLALSGSNWVSCLEAQTVLAMAQYQRKQGEQARANLAASIELSEAKLPKIESGDIGEMWLDWVIGQALLREARGLIGDATAEAPLKVVSRNESGRQLPAGAKPSTDNSAQIKRATDPAQLRN